MITGNSSIINGNGNISNYLVTSIIFAQNNADLSYVTQNYTVYGFTKTGTTYTLPFYSPVSSTIYAFVVAGGGGAGSIGSGGGGGGGVVLTHITVPSGLDTMTVSVGAGGNSPWSSTGGLMDGGGYTGYDGSNSTVTFAINTSLNITANYGGHSDMWIGQDGSNTGSGGSGGSGGGASGGIPGYATVSVGSYRTTAFYGCSGGTSNGHYTGGGGGAGALGGNATGSSAGNGGIGVKCTLPGISSFSPWNSYYYGSGGGGSTAGSAGFAGSFTGGGAGSGYTNPGVASQSGQNASNNTGGGGGGSAYGTNGRFWPSGGSGGSGIVFIAVPKMNPSNIFSFFSSSPIMWLDASVASSITYFQGTSNVSGWKDLMGNYNFGTIGGNSGYITYDSTNKRLVMPDNSAGQQVSGSSESTINSGAFTSILRSTLSSNISLSNGGTFYCVLQIGSAH